MKQLLVVALLVLAPLLEAASLEQRIELAVDGLLARCTHAGEDSLCFSWTLPALGSLAEEALELEVEPMQIRERGTSVVRMRLHQDGVTRRRLTLPVRVERWRRVPVAAQDLAHGRILEASDLRLAMVDVTEMSDTDLPTLDELVGLQLTRHLSAGRPVYSRTVRALPDVRKGEALRVIVRSGGVQVEAPATAMEEARRGELLLVRLESTGKRLRARLLNEDLALVEAGS